MVRRDRLFQTIAAIGMTLLALFCILPIVMMIVSSFSSEEDIIHNGYTLIPHTLDFTAYQYILNSSSGEICSVSFSFNA